METSDEQPIPTLDDVARVAGVSTATVSRCLNDAGKVTAKTRERVMAAVEQLGYTPNFGARAMAAKRTFTIGAIIPTMENAIFARGIQAFQEALHEKGYTLLVSSTGYQPAREAEQIKALIARGADGLLLIGYQRDAEVYAYLQKRGVPTLLAWAYAQENPFPAIGFDNRAEMRRLATEVLGMGHREIAVISAPVEGNDRAAMRLKGIADALEEAGLDPKAATIVQTPYGIETGGAAMVALMQGPKRPTAVICGNDLLAVGALQRAQEIGLRVPEDVSITGFDDMDLARIVTPQLTTMEVPHRQMGTQAAEALVRMVEKRDSGGSQKLDCTLKLRGSLRRAMP